MRKDTYPQKIEDEMTGRREDMTATF